MKTIQAKMLDATHLELRQPLSATQAERIEVVISEDDDEPCGEQRTAGRRTVAGTRLREREDAWCRAHPEVLKRHAGQWLVVEGEELVAHGEDPASVVRRARDRGVVAIPYVFFVEPPRRGVVKLGL